MKVYVPTPLRSYTGKQSVVEADGNTVGTLMLDLDRRFPGFRFRIIDEQDQIREHVRIFLNRELARDLATPIQPGEEVRIIMAISGG